MSEVENLTRLARENMRQRDPLVQAFSTLSLQAFEEPNLKPSEYVSLDKINTLKPEYEGHDIEFWRRTLTEDVAILDKYIEAERRA